MRDEPDEKSIFASKADSRIFFIPVFRYNNHKKRMDAGNE
jgi:hypothetical protein